ncbi:hypothetical protein [Novosphingobium sp. TCA1]|jgi:hypothetical protein|uniref:hypothetical protein n=1 Tax=Novosphingobium sp. TCA1 TaxID=2682474 RepID=UPI001309AFC6|nr:hypothetical protein [Novosphingobium sp. TCA1]GFE72352.1 hypothetical protein NTCA1_00010 [Novosphingobium sp. TCA1]
MTYDPRQSEHYPHALAIKVDHHRHNENEIQAWLHQLSPGEWDMTFDNETSEMFIFLPNESLSVLAKLTWGGAA